MNKAIYFFVLINSIVLVYLLKFPIDPFLPVNISFFLDEVHTHELPGFVAFGKVLIEICNLDLVSLLRLPIALFPLCCLTLAILKKVVKDKNFLFCIFLIFIIFSEGLYLFVHHISFILFLAFLFCLLIIAKTDAHNIRKFTVVLYLSLTTLTISGYKLIYLALFILIIYSFFLYIFGEKNLRSRIIIITITCLTIFFGFHAYIKKSLPEFIYYFEQGSILGLEQWFNALLKLPIKYCYYEVCFDPYYYTSPLISAIGHGGIYLIIFFSIIIFLKYLYILQKEMQFKFLITSFLISGSSLAFMYSMMGFFHISYLLLPGTLIAGYVLSKKSTKIMLYTTIFLVLLAYVGTISSYEQRFDPFGFYVSLTNQATKWIANKSTTEMIAYGEVFSRGVYTFYWKKYNYNSSPPSWLKMEDLAKFIKNEKDGILILNFGIPWWEMENWFKILPPKKYFSELISAGNLVYSSGDNFRITIHNSE